MSLALLLAPERKVVAHPCQPLPSTVGPCHRPLTPLQRSQAVPARAGHRRRTKRVDSLTGNCGLCQRTLFQSIGIMAANGDYHPLLATAHGQTTPTRIAPGLGYTSGSRMLVAIGKPSSGPIHPAKTTPAYIASGPAQAPSRARKLDNRRRMRAVKPSSKTNDGASLSLSARARPCSPSGCCRHAPARAGPSAC